MYVPIYRFATVLVPSFFIICHWVLLVLLRWLLLDFLQKKIDIDNWALFCQ
jgi:hypothetical protein